MSKRLWQPSQSTINASSITKLLNQLGLKDFAQLHQWSIDNLDDFWSLTWQLGQIKGVKGEIAFEMGQEFIDSRFFPNAKLNVAQNLIENNLTTQIAMTEVRESGQRVEITWDMLRNQVAMAANAMLAIGIKPGDNVAAWVPNLHQSMIFAIAALSIGAVVSTASPDFGAPAVLDRFGQIQPKLLLACTSYQYHGKVIDCNQSLDQIVDGLSSLSKVVVINDKSSKYEDWDSWLSPFIGAELMYEKFPFDHPGFILFSSGTTGKPKCIVHRAAGILLKLRAEQLYNFDFDEKDKVFFYTTCGWMMWNWLLYLLASGASILLYDASPTYPKVDKLLAIAADEKCTHLGLSAKYIDLLSKSNIQGKDYDLASLRCIISTGSVLSPQSFEYIYNQIKSDIHLASISGGTDICGCFISAVPTWPVYAGEIQAPCLGMAVDVFDDAGRSEKVGQSGELVCRKPFPSMPIGFWNDVDNLNYKQAYFSKFRNIWAHGDFASKSENFGYLIHGRSDATLNAKGVRIGTAEIYRVVEEVAQVVESLAVTKEVDNDLKVILFVVLAGGNQLTPELTQEIVSRLRVKASPRHVPDLILQAPNLPKTKSNKLVEIAVADLINGRRVRNIDGLSNPEVLEWFSKLDFSSQNWR